MIHIKNRKDSEELDKQSGLTAHFQNDDTDTLLFKCQYCSLSFSRKGLRDAHQIGHTNAQSAN